MAITKIFCAAVARRLARKARECEGKEILDRSASWDSIAVMLARVARAEMAEVGRKAVG